MKKQYGFTLIEIALVMAIVGILLGAALKGQQLIDNARLKRTVNDVDILKTAYYSYLERYQAIPGDDRRASVHLGYDDIKDGNGNGVIQGNFNAVNQDESQLVWQHLRAADLYQGGFTSAAQALQHPLHAWGGMIGFADDSYDMNGASICLQEILGEKAMIMDIQNDDGLANSGSIRAGTSVATATAADSYDRDEFYHLCFDI